MGVGTGEAPCSPASAAGQAPPPGTAAAFVPAARRREALFTTGPGSEAGTDEEPITERASAGAGSGKEATGAVTAERAAVWGDGASSSREAGKSSQSSSPGSTTSPPPDDDRPYSAARRSASAASAAASMGRAGPCCSDATVGTASAAGTDEISTVFLRPRPPGVDGRPARGAALRPVVGKGGSSPDTDAATEGFPRADSATGAVPCSPASRGEEAPPPGTEAAFVLAARRRRGALLAAAGTGSGAGTDGETSTKRASAGAGSGQGATGAVTAERAAGWGDGASSYRGAGKSSQSSSPGSTTRPPPDDDRPYSAARRSASAASAAASMGRAGACCASGATVGTASATGAGKISAVFLRPRPPEVDERRTREEGARFAAACDCSSPGPDATASTADGATEGPATGVATCPSAPDAGAVPPSGTETAFALAARRRRADVFFGGTTGSGGVAATGAAPSDGTTGGTSGTLPVAKASDASSSGRFPASVRELLPDGGVFFRLVFRLREDAGSAACFFSRSSAGAFPAGAAPCAAFCPFPAVFSDRDGDGSRPQASSNERAVAVMTVTRLRDNRLLVSSPAAGDRSGAASEGEDMELLDYIQIG